MEKVAEKLDNINQNAGKNAGGHAEAGKQVYEDAVNSGSYSRRSWYYSDN